ncbi:hypothetical protein [Algoriphagus boritolerans]|uniref:hypothetical protein n=1 Tax=Algoriphagus boritolerans TaxID=308111 RepID=UPI002FCE1EC3
MKNILSCPKCRREERKPLRLYGLLMLWAFTKKNTGIFLMRYTEGVYSGYEKDIIQRFSKVFEQAYTRFLDLQKAEAQALEVIKRASVDRVRAEIASMRTTSDLERIQPLIWNELNILGVPLFVAGFLLWMKPSKKCRPFFLRPMENPLLPFTCLIIPPNNPGRSLRIGSKRKYSGTIWMKQPLPNTPKTWCSKAPWQAMKNM